MDILNSIHIDATVLKEPRGFIRIVQFGLSILAFATISSVSTQSSFTVQCINTGPKVNSTVDKTISIKYGYPFKINGKAEIKLPLCESPQSTVTDAFGGNFSPSAEFFCFVGVMSFLLCLFLLAAYVGFSRVFSSNTLASKVDFIGSIVWTVVWFIACVAWADNLAKLGKYMSPENLISDLREYPKYSPCSSPENCQPGEAGDHSTLVVSVLFGFLNMGVWGASLWFLYKETEWHRDKPADGQQQSFEQPYATQDYHPQEYQADPSVPTTPTTPNY